MSRRRGQNPELDRPSLEDKEAATLSVNLMSTYLCVLTLPNAEIPVSRVFMIYWWDKVHTDQNDLITISPGGGS